MAYEFYFDKTLLPVAPSKLQLKIGGTNKTCTLINEGEINMLKLPKLTEISFDILIPSVQYGFATYTNGEFKSATHYLKLFESLMTKKQPFQFIVNRSLPNGQFLFGTNMKVSLEDYTIKEDVKEGFDIVVNIKLKQYKDYGTKTCDIQFALTKPSVTVKTTRATSSNAPGTPANYTIVRGDTLWGIARKHYNKATQALVNGIYNANKTVIENAAKAHGKSSSQNGHWIWPGTKLHIPNASDLDTTKSTKSTTSKNRTGSKTNPPFVILSKSYSLIKHSIPTWNEAYGIYKAGNGSNWGWRIYDKDQNPITDITL